mgnify:CR=1 FL=1
MTGLDVFAYLDKDLLLPIIDGMQAPGNHIVVPYSLLKNIVSTGSGRESTKCPYPESSC